MSDNANLAVTHQLALPIFLSIFIVIFSKFRLAPKVRFRRLRAICSLPVCIPGIPVAGLLTRRFPVCPDVDECSENSHSCGDGSTCRNTPGSYRCMCNGQEAQRFETCTGRIIMSTGLSRLFSSFLQTRVCTNMADKVLF